LSVVEQKSFLAAIAPFDRLTDKQLDKASAAVDIEYFKTGTQLLARGYTPDYLYIVIKGVVQEIDSEGTVTLHGHQDSFDAAALLNRNSVFSEFTVQEEALCYLLPATVFQTLADTNPQFKQFYFQDLSQRIEELVEQRQAKELAPFMVAKISDVYIHPTVFVEADQSIYEAVATLKAHKATSVLVRQGKNIGIVTDTDIREHVVLQRKSIDTPVGDIATYQLICVPYTDFLFNALLLMTKRSVKRLVVQHEGQLVGVLDQMDLLSYFSNHSHLIAVQIERATATAQLKVACQSFISLIQSLYAKGVKIHYIAQLVTELNHQVFKKLFTLLAPPALLENACLLVMGSEGRGEQIFRTDQDNALILRAGFEFPELATFTQTFIETLIDFGYPPCPGQVMINNPQWTRTQPDFQDQIYDWINNPGENSLMNMAIFYDATAVAGDATLLEHTKDYLFSRFASNAGYFSQFARPVLAFETPLGWFAQFVVDRAHNNELDLKKGAIFPIVHGVRCLALQYRLTETHTSTRIKLLQEQGVLDANLASNLQEAFSFLLSLRLKAGLDKYGQGEGVHDNYINPASLGKLERDLLKDSLVIVNDFKKFLIYHFKLNLVT